jgi:hypothetical protein
MIPLRGAAGVFMVLLILFALAGCSQPDAARAPAQVNSTPSVLPSSPPVLANTSVNTTSVTAATKLPSTVSPVGTPMETPAVSFERYTGPDYAIDYPAGWNATVARLPLRQYSYSGAGCMVTEAYQLEQDKRTWRSPDGKSVLLVSIVSTQRDIWPRGFDGQIVYADIANSFFGNPDHCANTPDGTFSITGLADVPVAGVPLRGTHYDFGKINATGFTEGTGACTIVTGMNNRGVFSLYHAGKDPGISDAVSQRIFNSLRLDSRF